MSGEASPREVLEKYVERLKQLLPREAIVDIKVKGKDKVYVEVKREYLPEALEKVYWELGGYLSSMVGTDDRNIDSHYRLYYIISIEEDIRHLQWKPWIVVYTKVPWDDPSFKSTTPKVPAASWYEREVKDLLGLEPIGHPDPRRLALPDDWPEGLYPMRKDFKFYERPPRQPKPYIFRPEKVSEGIVQIPMSPIHALADEPSQFRLFVDGERIVDVDYRMFYVFRGLEKLAEERFTYNQTAFLAERVCGICGYAHSTAYCEAVEDALDIEVPERAEYIRTIMLEVERLHSHMLNLGIACHLTAFDWGFMELFRIREKIMKIAEILSGGRKTYGMNLVGGVRRDIPRDKAKKVIELLKTVREEFKRAIDIITSNELFVRRCEGVGILPKKVARALSVVGPLVRGSGIPRDVRYDHPYAAYKYIRVKPAVESGCDVLSRLMVRAREVLDAIDIVEHALDQLPGGPILNEEKIELVEYAKGIGYDEAPRGENVHFVVIGKDSRVHKWRVRAATYNNWPALPYMSRDYTITDFPLIVASLDPCYSCTERVVIVDVKSGKTVTVSYARLVHLSRKVSQNPTHTPQLL